MKTNSSRRPKVFETASNLRSQSPSNTPVATPQTRRDPEVRPVRVGQEGRVEDRLAELHRHEGARRNVARAHCEHLAASAPLQDFFVRAAREKSKEAQWRTSVLGSPARSRCRRALEPCPSRAPARAPRGRARRCRHARRSRSPRRRAPRTCAQPLESSVPYHCTSELGFVTT